MGMQPTCQDCGKPVVTGVRCRPCNGTHIRLVYAERLHDEDRALIQMVEDEHLTPARLGDRLGISRVGADMRIKGARKRLAIMQATK